MIKCPTVRPTCMELPGMSSMTVCSVVDNVPRHDIGSNVCYFRFPIDRFAGYSNPNTSSLFNRKLNEADTAAERNDSRTLHRINKELTDLKCKSMTVTIKSIDGRKLTSEENNARWIE